MGYTLTSSGLQRTQTVKVQAGQMVYFGASASPDFVEVAEVNDKWITVNKRSGAVKVERWIAEDLIARGNATMARRAADLERTASEASGDFGAAMRRLYAEQAQMIRENLAGAR